MGLLGNSQGGNSFARPAAGALDARRIITTAQERSSAFARNIWQAPLAVPAAAVDTTISSLANLSDATGLTDFDLHDGIIPQGWEGYHSSRDAWRTTSDVASMFFIAGAAAKAARVGSAGVNATQRLGLSEDMARRIFSDRRTQGAIEREVAERWGTQTVPYAMQGLNHAGFDDIATTFGTIQGRMLTQAEARQQGLRLSRNNAIKETIAGELAIVALMNDSEFLFPEDASLTGYLLSCSMFIRVWRVASANFAILASASDSTTGPERRTPTGLGFS